VEYILAVGLIVLGVLMLSFVWQDPVLALGLGMFLIGLGGGIGWLGLRAATTTLLKDGQLQIHRQGLEQQFSLTEVRGVRIAREVKLFLPTDIELLIAGQRPVTVDRYFLSGVSTLQRATALAVTLGVDLLDPEGEQLRQSRLAALRWRAAGAEWAFTLSVFVVILTLMGGIIGVFYWLGS
jgi:hypothetical protein